MGCVLGYAHTSHISYSLTNGLLANGRAYSPTSVGLVAHT